MDSTYIARNIDTIKKAFFSVERDKPCPVRTLTSMCEQDNQRFARAGPSSTRLYDCSSSV